MQLRRVILISVLCSCATAIASGQQPDSKQGDGFYDLGIDRLYHQMYTAFSSRDMATASAILEKIHALDPNDPQAILSVAAARYRAGKKDESFRLLRQLADRKLGFWPDAHPVFAPLRTDPEFQKVLAAFEASDPRVGNSTVAFTIPEPDLIPEGIAHDPVENAFYVGSIYKRKILKVDNGKVSIFASPDASGLFGVLGMKVDPKRRVLWVASAAGSELKDKDGWSGLFKFDLKSGKLVKKYIVEGKPGEHLFNDVALTASGDVYATDSHTGAVYRLEADSDQLTPFLAAGSFVYPNGIALSPREDKLFIASYGAGITVVELATKRLRKLAHGTETTTAGIDGLYFANDSLIAVQNGIGPGRIVRFRLSPALDRITRTEVLESRNPKFNPPTTGAIAGPEFYYIANAQLGAIDGSALKKDFKLEDILILNTRIDPAANDGRK